MNIWVKIKCKVLPCGSELISRIISVLITFYFWHSLTLNRITSDSHFNANSWLTWIFFFYLPELTCRRLLILKQPVCIHASWLSVCWVRDTNTEKETVNRSLLDIQSQLPITQQDYSKPHLLLWCTWRCNTINYKHTNENFLPLTGR